MALKLFQKAETDDRKDEQYSIIVDNVSKHFRIPHERRLTVYDNIMGMFNGKYTYEEFWALHDVSFKVRRSETFGIIGHNGSGKSTLLKILAGVLFPDSGVVKINGRIAPFLELGVGFQPELTAKDNVYLYGAIMGLPRKEIDRKYEDILEFAEMKRFENMKLKNYSSGMYVRLAFSTAIQVNPEILLIDEVLSVGDEAFQRKCSQKINEIRESGKTIIFVSHSLPAVKSLCERTMLLSNGRVVMIDDTDKVIAKYLEITGRQ